MNILEKKAKITATNVLEKRLVLKCRHCKGEGIVPNPYFEYCMTNEEFKRPIGGCNACSYQKQCYGEELTLYGGEFTHCDDCQGRGVVTFNLEDWQISGNVFEELWDVFEGTRKAKQLVEQSGKKTRSILIKENLQTASQWLNSILQRGRSLKIIV